MDVVYKPPSYSTTFSKKPFDLARNTEFINEIEICYFSLLLFCFASVLQMQTLCCQFQCIVNVIHIYAISALFRSYLGANQYNNILIFRRLICLRKLKDNYTNFSIGNGDGMYMTLWQPCPQLSSRTLNIT